LVSENPSHGFVFGVLRCPSVPEGALANEILEFLGRRLSTAAKTLAEPSKRLTDRREALWSVEACLRYGMLGSVAESGGKPPHSTALRDSTEPIAESKERGRLVPGLMVSFLGFQGRDAPAPFSSTFCNWLYDR